MNFTPVNEVVLNSAHINYVSAEVSVITTSTTTGVKGFTTANGNCNVATDITIIHLAYVCRIPSTTFLYTPSVTTVSTAFVYKKGVFNLSVSSLTSITGYLNSVGTSAVTSAAAVDIAPNFDIDVVGTIFSDSSYASATAQKVLSGKASILTKVSTVLIIPRLSFIDPVFIRPSTSFEFSFATDYGYADIITGNAITGEVVIYRQPYNQPATVVTTNVVAYHKAVHHATVSVFTAIKTNISHNIIYSGDTFTTHIAEEDILPSYASMDAVIYSVRAAKSLSVTATTVSTTPTRVASNFGHIVVYTPVILLQDVSAAEAGAIGYAYTTTSSFSTAVVYTKVYNMLSATTATGTSSVIKRSNVSVYSSSTVINVGNTIMDGACSIAVATNGVQHGEVHVPADTSIASTVTVTTKAVVTTSAKATISASTTVETNVILQFRPATITAITSGYVIAAIYKYVAAEINSNATITANDYRLAIRGSSTIDSNATITANDYRLAIRGSSIVNSSVIVNYNTRLGPVAREVITTSTNIIVNVVLNLFTRASDDRQLVIPRSDYMGSGTLHFIEIG